MLSVVLPSVVAPSFLWVIFPDNKGSYRSLRRVHTFDEKSPNCAKHYLLEIQNRAFKYTLKVSLHGRF
jgi:hypothetical protein